MRTVPLFALVALSLFACDAPADDPGREAAGSMSSSAESAATAAAAGPVVVYKSPTCGCCNGWVEHLREHGYEVDPVDVVNYDDLAARKSREGVPADLGSCHTAVVDGYVVEGHVPAAVIERLLRERPDIRGLAVPGMPIGSPGMEGPGAEPYDVIAFDDDGGRSVYATIDPAAGN